MPQSSAKETAEVAMSRLDLVTVKSSADATGNDDTQCKCVTMSQLVRLGPPAWNLSDLAFGNDGPSQGPTELDFC